MSGLLRYAPNRDKIIEGALFLMGKADEGGRKLTASNLMTAMFIADKAHQDTYGRPVFFDNYIATKNGPQGVAAIEMLNTNYDWINVEIEIAPWVLQGNNITYQSLRPTNMRRLSESDVEAMEQALVVITNDDSSQLETLTLRNQAFLTAWDDGAGEGCRLDPRFIPDELDEELIEQMVFVSHHAYCAPRL